MTQARIDDAGEDREAPRPAALIVDSACQVVSASPGFADLVGLEAEAVIGGSPPHPWWAAGDAHRFAALLRRAVHDPASVPAMLATVVTGCGEAVPVQVEVSASQADGTPTAWIVMLRAFPLDAAAEAVADPIALWSPIRDEAGRVVDLELRRGNGAARRLFRAAEDPVPAPSRPRWHSVAGRLDAGLLAELCAVAEGHGHVASRLVGIRGAGEPERRAFEVDATRVGDAVVTSWRDVTRWEAAVEREARFAGNVAHELRTPLMALSAAVHAADRRADGADGEAAEAIRTLGQHVETFERLVLDLLEISRFDTGRAQLDLRRVTPARLVEATLSATGRRDVPLVVEADTPGEVDLDGRRIHQVLTNLLDNADRYAGGAVRVRLSGDERTVRFDVDDAGTGVPPTERESVFERFRRGRPSRPGGPRGSGLGLSLVREHVRLHGGRAWIEDSPEGGARMAVELPARRAVPPSAEA